MHAPSTIDQCTHATLCSNHSKSRARFLVSEYTYCRRWAGTSCNQRRLVTPSVAGKVQRWVSTRAKLQWTSCCKAQFCYSTNTLIDATKLFDIKRERCLKFRTTKKSFPQLSAIYADEKDVFGTLMVRKLASTLMFQPTWLRLLIWIKSCDIWSCDCQVASLHYEIKGNSVFTNRHGAACREWIPLLQREGKVIFIFSIACMMMELTFDRCET